ncbi:EpsG family protein [Vibrio sp. 1159]|uniref:EpsG family protein n=1 Tax=Vibrio sp. 1159 TaxID=3074545 RepID=UPI002965562E|nr:EpsG family protein [Vibrio sp. 1159]MDW2318786.1 EpsG family protein [Vibrio sp. 1159]
MKNNYIGKYVSPTINKHNLIIVRFILVLLTFSTLPTITVLFLLVYLSLTFKRNIESYIYIFLVVLFVASVNSTKVAESDLSNYYEWYRALEDIPFIYAYKFRPTDPVFIYTTSLLTVFDNEKTFLLFWNCLSIGLVLIACVNINRYLGNVDNKFLYIQLVAGVFYFSQPEHMSHTTRAFASLAFMLLAMSYMLSNSKKKYYLLSFIGIGIHSSSIVLLGQVLKLRTLIILLPISYILGIGNLFSIIKALLNGLSISIFNVYLDYYIYRASDLTQQVLNTKQFLVFIVELGIVLLLVLFNRKTYKSPRIYNVLAPFLFISCLVLIFRNVPLFSVRMFLYHNYYFFISLSVAFIFLKNMHYDRVEIKCLFSLLTSMFFFLMYLYKYIFGSHWTYEVFSDQLLLSSWFEIVR